MKNLKIHKKYEVLFTKHGCREIIITGGRGSGKSFVVAVFLRWYMSIAINAIILYTRWTMKNAYKSIIPEFNEKSEMLGYSKRSYVKTEEVKDTITNSEITFQGILTSAGNQTANLKSIKGLSVFVMDEAEELHNPDTYDDVSGSIRTKDNDNIIMLIMNPKSKEHWVYKRFFEEPGVDPKFCGIHNDVLYIHTSYLDMLEHLSDSYIKNLEKMKRYRPARFKHIYEGEWLDDTEGALWTESLHRLAKKLYDESLEPTKIVVAVDPSVEDTGKQDDCGIIVAGKLPGDDNYVVLEDATGLYSPSEWGAKAIEMYKKWNANAIVVEKNQGGQLCVDNIRNSAKASERASIKIETVHASKGKVARAEPIATLYENECVAHAEGLEELEAEQRTYTGAKGQKSPGRYDACVWALTYLSKAKRKARMWM